MAAIQYHVAFSLRQNNHDGGGKRQSKKKSGKSKRAHHETLAKDGVSPPVKVTAPVVPKLAAPVVAGTAAGGGGRWVHDCPDLIAFLTKIIAFLTMSNGL